ncbi:hypothetical protein HPB51_003266 [Rhipicephalus microplus]|uniref:Uncharacterized protein n=1 Tax=Rhipicephalus microplus TaxID=6941 RepID=A0A9J6EWL6_RHIMP|nr:hypothetical protein HPB51_003266 [Rhipicephalus microplus]
MRNLLTASIGGHSWDALKQAWRESCTDESKKLKHWYYGLVRATLQRIQIVERREHTSLLMKTYANDLKLKSARLRTLTSTMASSYQARRLPSSNPQVLNYINSTRLGQMENLGHNSLPPEHVGRRLQFVDSGAEPLEFDAATLRLPTSSLQVTTPPNVDFATEWCRRGINDGPGYYPTT